MRSLKPTQLQRQFGQISGNVSAMWKVWSALTPTPQCGQFSGKRCVLRKAKPVGVAGFDVSGNANTRTAGIELGGRLPLPVMCRCRPAHCDVG